MAIRLRGHHLLCLLGFRGMGYSKAFSENMAVVYNRLQNQPDSFVSIVMGPDDLCACFPPDEEPHCDNRSVKEHDERVLDRLGLQAGTTLPWSSVLERVRSAIVPGDTEVFCSSCQWRSYGVCEEGIRIVKQGKRLPPLP